MIEGLLDFGGRRRLPSILQTEAAECGLACLAMIASYHGHRIDLNTLRRRHPVSLRGVTLRGLIQLASQLHLASRPVRYELEDIRELTLPAIVHWDLNHFVVLKAVTAKGVVVHDPATGVKTLTLETASKHLTGIALELSPAEGFAPKQERARLPFRVFWAQMPGMSSPLAQIFLLSVILELLVVAAPFYMQLTVDEVVARGDTDLMLALALGFGLLMAIQVATNALRSHIMLVVQNAMHFQMGARLFHHLLRLPLEFFEKRHIGDVLSRFNSLTPIRTAMAEGLVLAAIDGIMALATLAMIFVYSAQLALVTLAALLFYVVLRLVHYRRFRDLNEAKIQADAQENSNFIETARAIQTVKLFNRESDREAQWLNRYADAVNADIRLGRAQVQFQTMNRAIFGVEQIVTVYLAAMLALDNLLTVGMIFAFMSYKQNFTTKASTLVEKAIEFRLLDLHLERLSDIAMNPLERGHDRPLAYAQPIQGALELRNVSFRYAETERFVLENVNLKVEAGKFITIMGPSGGGKTTLLKIMLGLLEPTSGEVLVDGIPLQTIGVRVYREQVAAVMQEDMLLSGSIADNICFFDPAFDQERMVMCAQMAGVHEEVMSMPMAYNSLIGDMGSSLSGGQKQRVLLARALYKSPRILFLDEGTAHLDVEKEKQINERLRRLAITRISVAHRPEMMHGTDSILFIGQDHRRPDVPAQPEGQPDHD
ncbi:ABC transporter [Siccirubricoccus deserti]|uniref:Peptidase domain-containing ABC transporter n=1 Tax=Siccirubricoccus deserti TaxID=2013562 RepID=A0A9X0QXF9_9PROT|nr:peptidase domain-containing ABC transporter [Siccirubricoccus deserti]MBC4015420.1 peptidase domain-containing ABC transporter [Siccirubricoccus deserti]GGC41510.1 ABC transporter [Siccirubricoccus deserti]